MEVNIELILSQFALMAGFAERVVQMAKGVFKYAEKLPEYQHYIDLGLSGGVNILLAFSWKFDVFGIFGFSIPNAEWAGFVMTGVLATAGSSIIHEVLELLKMFKENQKK